MNMLIDIILFAVIFFFAIIFFKRGIFGLALGILRLLLSVLAAVIMGKPLSLFIFEKFVSRDIGGNLGLVLSLIISYVLLFFISFALSFLIFRRIKRKSIPIIGFLDKLGGLLIGLAVGISVATIISTLLYGGITLAFNITNSQEILQLYGNSRLFKLIIDINLIDFIEKSLFLQR